MSGNVGDEFLRNAVERYRVASISPDDDSFRVATALVELLQRRKDGQSPEEFVIRMAGMTAAVRPEARGHFLHFLGEIQRHVLLVRQYIASMRGPPQCDGYGMDLDLGVVKTHEPHPATTPCPVMAP
jgi:hypothetical protein